MCIYVLTSVHGWVGGRSAKQPSMIHTADMSDCLMWCGGQRALRTTSSQGFACRVQASALGVVYPCLLLIYLGQAAYLTQHTASFSSLYYSSIPTPVYWPMFALALLASIVASQSIITGGAP